MKSRSVVLVLVLVIATVYTLILLPRTIDSWNEYNYLLALRNSPNCHSSFEVNMAIPVAYSTLLEQIKLLISVWAGYTVISLSIVAISHHIKPKKILATLLFLLSLIIFSLAFNFSVHAESEDRYYAGVTCTISGSSFAWCAGDIKPGNDFAEGDEFNCYHVGAINCINSHICWLAGGYTVENQSFYYYIEWLLPDSTGFQQILLPATPAQVHVALSANVPDWTCSLTVSGKVIMSKTIALQPQPGTLHMLCAVCEVTALTSQISGRFFNLMLKAPTSSTPLRWQPDTHCFSALTDPELNLNFTVSHDSPYYVVFKYEYYDFTVLGGNPPLNILYQIALYGDRFYYFCHSGGAIIIDNSWIIRTNGILDKTTIY